MSKQSDAKQQQGYRQAAPCQCANCLHFSSTISQVHRGWGPPTNTWVKEANLRCNLGGFKVSKTAICNSWSLREGSES